jgi:hypothetical protein
MSAVTMESGSAQTAAYGGLVDAIGGIAAGVLAILGLTGFDPEGMAGIATIVIGAAFLIQTGAILSEYTHIVFQNAATVTASDLTGGDGLAAMFMVGAGGIVLGVLALLGMASASLTAIAVIAFGSALVLSSGSVRQLYLLRSQAMLAARSGPELLAGQMAAGSAGIQMLAGLTAVVLGVLAVAGHDTRVLTLVALLVLGITVLLSGSALSSLVLSFMRPAQGMQSLSRRSVG